MKKLLAILIVLVLTLSLLTACGESGGTGSTGTGSAGTGSDEGRGDLIDEDQAGDLTTVEGFLSYWGLTGDDLKCANFNRLDKVSYSLETGEIHEVGAYISAKLTDDEAKAWIEKVISKLNSLSAEGKLANILADGEELTADYIMAQSMHIGSGDFTYKGKKANAMISVIPGYLDSDDPDEAMAACSLKLTY